MNTAPFPLRCGAVIGQGFWQPISLLVCHNSWNNRNCFISFPAISQREISQYFPHLERDSSSIVTDISSFFKENIQAKFPLQNCE